MTMHTVRDWVQKAAHTSSDLQSNGGFLNAEQVREFLRVAINAAPMIRDGRQEFSNAVGFEVPRINFSSRMLHAGSEATRTTPTNRYVPSTGLLSLSTKLFRGELDYTDEALEDNVEGARYADTLMMGAAERVGLDVEEIAIKSDTDRDSNDDSTEKADLGQFDGIIASAQDNFNSAQKINAASLGGADGILEAMIEALPSKYRQRQWNELRLYVPTALHDAYWNAVETRQTVLGDIHQDQDRHTMLRKRGIPVVEVPSFSGASTVGGNAINYATFAILTHPKNIVWGFHRRVRVERWRDPREGTNMILPTVRFDVGYADPGFGVLASSVPTSF